MPDLELTKPVKMSLRKLAELAGNNEIEFTGPFTLESSIVHRPVTPDLFRAHVGFSDPGKRGQTDWYYVDVTQTNGQKAWSSPIWMEG